MVRPVDFRRGDILFRQGDPSRAIYFVRSGEVQLFQGGVPLLRIGPEGVLGEWSLMAGKPRADTAEAVGDVHCLMLRKGDFNVRRGKALSSGGCEPRATAVAPVGSSQGGLRRQRCRLKHSGDKGPRMAAQQPCGPEREVNAEQASKHLTQKPTLRCLGEGRWQIGKRATYAPICICRGSGASTHGR